jgi:hypothetical protein
MSAYMMPSHENSFGSDTDDDIASLPSESTTDSDLETLSDDYSDAEAEWRESIEQLELLLTMVLVPFVGKYLGRRCAYWSMHNRSNCLREYQANFDSDRLDKIHAVEVPGRGSCYEPGPLQGCRCHRGSCKPMITLYIAFNDAIWARMPQSNEPLIPPILQDHAQPQQIASNTMCPGMLQWTAQLQTRGIKRLSCLA